MKTNLYKIHSAAFTMRQGSRQSPSTMTLSFYLLPGKTSAKTTQLQLFGNNFHSDVSSNMVIIGKINIWNISPAARTVLS